MKTGKLMLAAITMVSAASAGCKQHDIQDTYNFDETITALDVNADADVKVETSDDNTGYVDVDVSYRGPDPEYDVTMSGSTLRVVYKCRFACEGTIVVRVPPTVVSTLHTDSGNLDVRDLEGDATVSADSGNIHLTNLSGNLDLEADSGNISGTVWSEECIADVDSGNISLKFEEIPSNLDFAADSGNVTIRVPTAPYNISTHVDSGDREIDNVTVDSTAPNTIRADVDSGNISIIGY